MASHGRIRCRRLLAANLVATTALGASRQLCGGTPAGLGESAATSSPAVADCFLRHSRTTCRSISLSLSLPAAAAAAEQPASFLPNFRHLSSFN
uniref:Secreted protein n=1 Tax=Oryza nivara TaxID=4536 RepID=A0A0E0I6D6_ORYNI